MGRRVVVRADKHDDRALEIGHEVEVESVRRLALQTTKLANATCATIRLRLFKISALVTVSVRRITFAFASGYPYKAIFAIAQRALAAANTS
jgi:hypothetical protein